MDLQPATVSRKVVIPALPEPADLVVALVKGVLPQRPTNYYIITRRKIGVISCDTERPSSTAASVRDVESSLVVPVPGVGLVSSASA
jgi:hypothetical protein